MAMLITVVKQVVEWETPQSIFGIFGSRPRIVRGGMISLSFNINKCHNYNYNIQLKVLHLYKSTD